MQIRACRDCGEEYRLDAQVSECVECGGPIETHDDTTPDVTAPPASVSAGPYRRFYAADRPAELEPLAKRLGTARIPFTVRSGRHGFELWVPVAEAEHARQQLPEWFPPAADDAAEVDPEAGPARCPACDTELTTTDECATCGLAVGAIEDDCPRCGAKLDPDQDLCPACGH